MIARDAARAGTWVLALSLCACSAKPPSEATAPPAAAPAATGDAEAAPESAAKAEETATTPADELATLDGQVDQAWRELQALDEARLPVAATPGEATARCERIRGLADEICTLRDRMCTLATEHPGQRRYADACARAGDTCQQARQAAERCPAT